MNKDRHTISHLLPYNGDNPTTGYWVKWWNKGCKYSSYVPADLRKTPEGAINYVKHVYGLSQETQCEVSTQKKW